MLYYFFYTNDPDLGFCYLRSFQCIYRIISFTSKCKCHLCHVLNRFWNFLHKCLHLEIFICLFLQVGYWPTIPNKCVRWVRQNAHILGNCCSIWLLDNRSYLRERVGNLYLLGRPFWMHLWGLIHWAWLQCQLHEVFLFSKHLCSKLGAGAKRRIVRYLLHVRLLHQWLYYNRKLLNSPCCMSRWLTSHES